MSFISLHFGSNSPLFGVLHLPKVNPGYRPEGKRNDAPLFWSSLLYLEKFERHF